MEKVKNKKNIKIALSIAALLVSFYAGTIYSKNKTPVSMRGNQNFSGAMGQNGARFARGGNAVSGEILTKDDKSITIKLRDGGSRIAFMGQTTQILKSSAGTFADISVGAQVSVVGTQNSDGSMIAQSVQLRPSLPSDSPASSTANQ